MGGQCGLLQRPIVCGSPRRLAVGRKGGQITAAMKRKARFGQERPAANLCDKI